MAGPHGALEAREFRAPSIIFIARERFQYKLRDVFDKTERERKEVGV